MATDPVKHQGLPQQKYVHTSEYVAAVCTHVIPAGWPVCAVDMYVHTRYMTATTCPVCIYRTPDGWPVCAVDVCTETRDMTITMCPVCAHM